MPVLFCAFLHFGRLDIDLHPTNQYRTVSFASIFLPRTSFWPHYDAFRSNPPSLSFARELELVRAILLPSALHACALLPTSSGRLNGPFAPASNVSWAHTPHVYSWLIAENQGVPMRSLDIQITGLAHHCPCSSYLSRTSRTCFIQDSLFMMPFSGPGSFCPVQTGHGGKSSPSTSRLYAAMNKDREVVFFFARCCCHLSPQFFNLSVGAISTRMNSPNPCWHHTRS